MEMSNGGRSKLVQRFLETSSGISGWEIGLSGGKIGHFLPKSIWNHNLRHAMLSWLVITSSESNWNVKWVSFEVSLTNFRDLFWYFRPRNRSFRGRNNPFLPQSVGNHNLPGENHSNETPYTFLRNTKWNPEDARNPIEVPKISKVPWKFKKSRRNPKNPKKVPKID